MAGGGASAEECLSVPASRLMSTPPLAVGPSTPLWDVARRMYESNVGSALVVDSGRLEGIITRRDMLYYLASGIAAKNPPASHVMSRSVITARPEEPASEILRRMIELGIRHIPIVSEEGEPLGVVSSWDILQRLLECMEEASQHDATHGTHK